MINSKKGLNLFNQIKSVITFEESSYENASNENEQIVKPVTRPEERDFILKNWESNGYSYLNNFYKKAVRGIWKDKIKKLCII